MLQYSETTSDKAASNLPTNDRTTSDKAASNPSTNDRTTSHRTASHRTASHRTTSHRTTSDTELSRIIKHWLSDAGPAYITPAALKETDVGAVKVVF
nr:hypothetical protein [Erwinia rhapontici]